jgi:Cu+-exporting ATPase
VAALFAQSSYEVLSGRGEGYFDSLTGLLFFLLCGKLFQQKTFDRLAFDRDFKAFFPLSVTRRIPPRSDGALDPSGRNEGGGAFSAPQEARVSLSQLSVGDRLVIRNGELIPADGLLVEGTAAIDYSFVTGESEPVEKKVGDHLYAGARQIGGAIEIEMAKPVSQSYLTSLWDQEVFRKTKGEPLNTLTNRYSQRFTKIVIAIALGSMVFWSSANPALSIKSFTSVLIVACPCALALAAPFTLGTAQRILARRGVFLKNPYVIEALARVDAIVFDKTGTLTATGTSPVRWEGTPLSEAEERWLYSMTRHSTHPCVVRIGEAIAGEHFPEPVQSFLETAGRGMEGRVAQNEIWLGSAAWFETRGINAGRMSLAPQGSEPDVSNPVERGGNSSVVSGSAVHVAINGKYRGCYLLAGALRPRTGELLSSLSAAHELALLSGDNEKEHDRFSGLFAPSAHLRFNQSPHDKLGFIRGLQESGRTVMMVGDGLNDAGALKQSDVGVAVTENVSCFSPASDVILTAGMLSCVDGVLRFAKGAVRVVQASFLVSSIYNIVGIGIAASGNLSPVVCAILMPLSSLTVVAFACVVTTWLGKRVGLCEAPDSSSTRAVSELGAPKKRKESWL